jgi:hypothetical protein
VPRRGGLGCGGGAEAAFAADPGPGLWLWLGREEPAGRGGRDELDTWPARVAGRPPSGLLPACASCPGGGETPREVFQTSPNPVSLAPGLGWGEAPGNAEGSTGAAPVSLFSLG